MSNNQDFEANPDPAIPENPLHNLLNLFDELIEEDRNSEPTEFKPNSTSPADPVSTKTEIEEANNVDLVAEKSLDSSFKPESLKKESERPSVTDIPSKSDFMVDAKNDSSTSLDSQPDSVTDLTANYSDVLKYSDSKQQAKLTPDRDGKIAESSAFNLVPRGDLNEIYVSQQWIQEKEQKIDELAHSVNILIPLMVEVSKAQDSNSQEYILKTIVPIIDQIIQQRSEDDRDRMSAAIANILPDAIRQEISNVPESIGKAIAPEIALSIKEQTLLNEGAIAEAMGSEMGKAIKNQIAMERDAMVDALYPVIGSTISKYMGEVVASINERVDNALSPVGIQRKIRAKLRGISEAELILQESLPYSTRAIFLIHKDSGLVIEELQPDTESPLESDLLAGMLTAIKSFANDCIDSNSELDAIDYDKFRILFENAGYCYLAVVVNGEPNRQFRERSREIFSQIVIEYGDEIKNYQGNPATIPRSIQPLLEELTYQKIVEYARKSSKTLYWLIALGLGTVLLPWSIVKYQNSISRRIEKAIAIELDATPELSVYRLTPQIKKGTLSLTGRVPSTYLRDLAGQVSSQIAAEKNLQFDNQIIAVNVPVDPTVTAREVSRITKIVNQQGTTQLQTNYQDRIITIDGTILDSAERNNILASFSNIPGVEKVILIDTQKLPQIATRIYFSSGGSQFFSEKDSAKIEEIRQFLTKYPLIKLKIVGHSDRQGTREINLELAQARAKNVYQALIAKGIAPNRLQIVASSMQPPDLRTKESQPLWLSRCVRFESFVEQKK